MKLTLVDLASLDNPVTAIANINANSALIETALENTLSRNGTSPNTMSADLDMNSNQILNLPEPSANTDVVRLVDLTDAIDAVRSTAVLTGSASITRLLLDAGTAGAPSATFTIDSDTGLFRAGANAVGISGNGIEIGRFVYNTTYTAPLLGIGTTTPGASPASSGYPMLDGGIDVGGILQLHPEQAAYYAYGHFASTAYFADTTPTSWGWAMGLIDNNQAGLLYTTHAFSITPPHGDSIDTFVGQVWDPNWNYVQAPISAAGVDPSFNTALAIGYSYDALGAVSLLSKRSNLGSTNFVFSDWNDVISANLVFIRSAGYNLEVDSKNATDIPFLIKAHASQSNPVVHIKNGSSVLLSVSKDGYITIGESSGLNLSIGSGIATGVFGDASNIGIRTYATTAKIYFQNASGATTFGDWDTTRLNIANCLTVGAPTGGSKGTGTINVAADIYKNNTAYTNPDYVFEHFYTGEINAFKDNPGAEDYLGLMPINDLRWYIKQNYRFPGITNEASGMFERSDTILRLVEENALYLFNHEDRIKRLEQKLGEVF